MNDKSYLVVDPRDREFLAKHLTNLKISLPLSKDNSCGKKLMRFDNPGKMRIFLEERSLRIVRCTPLDGCKYWLYVRSPRFNELCTILVTLSRKTNRCLMEIDKDVL
jgi:hypothetical protein